MIRLEADDLAISFGCLGGFSRLGQARCQCVSWSWLFGLKLTGFRKTGDGLGVTMLLAEEIAEVHMGKCEIWCDLECATEQQFGFFDPVLACHYASQKPQCVDVIRLYFQNFAIGLLGIFQSTCFVMFGCEGKFLANRIQVEGRLERRVRLFASSKSRKGATECHEASFGIWV